MTERPKFPRSTTEKQLIEFDEAGKTRQASFSKATSQLPARVTIRRPGFDDIVCWTPEEVQQLAFRLEHRFAAPDELVETVMHGDIYDPVTGVQLDTMAASQVRAMLLGRVSVAGDDDDGDDGDEPDWLIRGVWERGTVPQFSGPSKSGKTLVIIDMIWTILVPGHRFLGVYERGPIHPADLARGIDYINTEVPKRKLNKYLRPLRKVMVEIEDADGERRMVAARSLLRVHSLRDGQGGPRAFNLFQPETFEAWRVKLLQCQECLGYDGDNTGPLVLIADNGTAVLRALQMNVQEHIGELNETFRDLATEVMADSALFVTHSDKGGTGALGGSISSAASDGEMLYRGIRKEPRAFSLIARLGEDIDWTPTTLDPETGLPIIDLMIGTNRPASIEAFAEARAEQEVLDKMTSVGKPMMTTAITGTGADGIRLRKALDRLLAKSLVTMTRNGKAMEWDLVVNAVAAPTTDDDITNAEAVPS